MYSVTKVKQFRRNSHTEVATRKTGSSALQLQHDLDLSYPTAGAWSHKIRKAMQDRDARYALNGTIELDDTYIGGKKKAGKRGRGAARKTPVLVAVESRPKGRGHVALIKPRSFKADDAGLLLAEQTRPERGPQVYLQSAPKPNSNLTFRALSSCYARIVRGPVTIFAGSRNA